MFAIRLLCVRGAEEEARSSSVASSSSSSRAVIGRLVVGRPTTVRGRARDFGWFGRAAFRLVRRLVVEPEDWVSQRTSFAQSSSVYVYDFVNGETRGVTGRFDSAVKAAWSSSEVDEVEHEAEWDEEEDAEEEEEEDLSSLVERGSW
jgi:hypothetical protein